MSSVVLPEGWFTAILGDYLYLKNGFAFKSSSYQERSEGSIPVIRISDLNGVIATDTTAVHVLVDEAAKGFEIEQGDLLIAMSGATTGKVGVYKGSQPAYQNQRVGNLKLNSSKYGYTRYRDYLIAFLSPEILKLAYGGAQPNISGRAIEEINVAFPPLAEQKVIADKLDSLLAQVDNIKNRLDALPTIIKRFKQSVLSAAVSGKLTDIINQRAFISLGNAGVTIKTGPFGSALHKADYVQDGIPVINPMHINDGKIYPSGSMTITKEKFAELSAWHLKHGDVIIGRRGEMGRAAVFDKSQKDMLCGTGSMILRGDESVLPDYLSIIVRSPVAVAYFNDGSVGTTMVNLNQSIIKELKVYFPEIEEQTEIVRRVEQLFAYADQIEQQVKNAQSRVNNLTQAILAKAFRGELTADWRAANPHLISGENSAQALLAKIKAERGQKAKK